jgi:hypothetical protein
VPGREQQALELFDQFFAYVAGLLARTELSAFRWYGLEDGDLGMRVAFIVLEGSPEQLDTIVNDDEFREFRYVAPSFVRHFALMRSRPLDKPEGMSLPSKAFVRWGLLEE